MGKLHNYKFFDIYVNNENVFFITFKAITFLLQFSKSSKRHYIVGVVIQHLSLSLENCHRKLVAIRVKKNAFLRHLHSLRISKIFSHLVLSFGHTQLSLHFVYYIWKNPCKLEDPSLIECIMSTFLLQYPKLLLKHINFNYWKLWHICN